MTDAVQFCGNWRGELASLPDDEIRSPFFDRLLERRKHRVHVQPSEDHAHDDHISLSWREHGHAAPDRSEERVRGNGSGLERVAA